MSHQTVATLVPYFNFLYSVSQLETLHSIIPSPPTHTPSPLPHPLPLSLLLSPPLSCPTLNKIWNHGSKNNSAIRFVHLPLNLSFIGQTDWGTWSSLNGSSWIIRRVRTGLSGVFYSNGGDQSWLCIHRGYHECE